MHLVKIVTTFSPRGNINYFHQNSIWQMILVNALSITFNIKKINNWSEKYICKFGRQTHTHTHKRSGQTDPTHNGHTSPKSNHSSTGQNSPGWHQAHRSGDRGWGTGGGAPRDLPWRRAPFLLKKVLPGQMGGPDVLKDKRNWHQRGLLYTHSPSKCPHTIAPSRNSGQLLFKNHQVGSITNGHPVSQCRTYPCASILTTRLGPAHTWAPKSPVGNLNRTANSYGSMA